MSYFLWQFLVHISHACAKLVIQILDYHPQITCLTRYFCKLDLYQYLKIYGNVGKQKWFMAQNHVQWCHKLAYLWCIFELISAFDVLQWRTVTRVLFVTFSHIHPSQRHWHKKSSSFQGTVCFKWSNIICISRSKTPCGLLWQELKFYAKTYGICKIAYYNISSCKWI